MDPHIVLEAFKVVAGEIKKWAVGDPMINAAANICSKMGSRRYTVDGEDVYIFFPVSGAIEASQLIGDFSLFNLNAERVVLDSSDVQGVNGVRFLANSISAETISRLITEGKGVTSDVVQYSPEEGMLEQIKAALLSHYYSVNEEGAVVQQRDIPRRHFAALRTVVGEPHGGRCMVNLLPGVDGLEEGPPYIRSGDASDPQGKIVLGFIQRYKPADLSV